jgi:hypothetical protein
MTHQASYGESKAEREAERKYWEELARRKGEGR